MKSLFKIFMVAAMTILVGCQKHDFSEQSNKNENNKATLTASIGDMTKVDFEDQGIQGLKLTWSAGDRIGLYDENNDLACVFILDEHEEGKITGKFVWQSGKPFDKNKTYKTVYPYIEKTDTWENYTAAKILHLATAQEQNGTTLSHMAVNCFMEGENDVNTNNITFLHTTSIMTIKLVKPATAGENEKPQAVFFDNGSNLHYKLNLKNGDWTTTAYMVIDPKAAGDRDLIFEVDTDAGKTYSTRKSSSKEYKAGLRYTADLAGSNLSETARMRFTIDTRKNPNNSNDDTFIVPFPDATGYSLSIKWGDGWVKNITSSVNITQDIITHKYDTPGVYQILIYSDQVDQANPQIPAMNFGNNYGYVNSNSEKLLSMDTPMLNTGTTDFTKCFEGCLNLTTIPTKLFDKNTEAINFNSCFSNCEKLQLNPNIFCDETAENIANRFADKTVDFDNCFYRNSFSGTKGIAPALWTYNFGSGSANSSSCFSGAGNSTGSLSNYTHIPTTWGGSKAP